MKLYIELEAYEEEIIKLARDSIDVERCLLFNNRHIDIEAEVSKSLREYGIENVTAVFVISEEGELVLYSYELYCTSEVLKYSVHQVLEERYCNKIYINSIVGKLDETQFRNLFTPRVVLNVDITQDKVGEIYELCFYLNFNYNNKQNSFKEQILHLNEHISKIMVHHVVIGINGKHVPNEYYTTLANMFISRIYYYLYKHTAFYTDGEYSSLGIEPNDCSYIVLDSVYERFNFRNDYFKATTSFTLKAKKWGKMLWEHKGF